MRPVVAIISIWTNLHRDIKSDIVHHGNVSHQHSMNYESHAVGLFEHQGSQTLKSSCSIANTLNDMGSLPDSTA